MRTRARAMNAAAVVAALLYAGLFLSQRNSRASKRAHSISAVAYVTALSGPASFVPRSHVRTGAVVNCRRQHRTASQPRRTVAWRPVDVRVGADHGEAHRARYSPRGILATVSAVTMARAAAIMLGLTPGMIEKASWRLSFVAGPTVAHAAPFIAWPGPRPTAVFLNRHRVFRRIDLHNVGCREAQGAHADARG